MLWKGPMSPISNKLRIISNLNRTYRKVTQMSTTVCKLPHSRECRSNQATWARTSVWVSPVCVLHHIYLLLSLTSSIATTRWRWILWLFLAMLLYFYTLFFFSLVGSTLIILSVQMATLHFLSLSCPNIPSLPSLPCSHLLFPDPLFFFTTTLDRPPQHLYRWIYWLRIFFFLLERGTFYCFQNNKLQNSSGGGRKDRVKKGQREKWGREGERKEKWWNIKREMGGRSDVQRKSCDPCIYYR